MILRNADTLKKTIQIPLSLSALENNPNNILSNIRNDYDRLNEIMNSINNSIKKYYFTEVFAENEKSICNNDFTDIIEKYFNDTRISKDMCDIVSVNDICDIDKADYERIVKEKFNIGDEVQG